MPGIEIHRNVFVQALKNEDGTYKIRYNCLGIPSFSTPAKAHQDAKLFHKPEEYIVLDITNLVDNEVISKNIFGLDYDGDSILDY